MLINKVQNVRDRTCRIIDITRGTTHDGPGMRTTVFFKGCPLNCLWCQNPESIKPGQEIWWEKRTCINCLACIGACPEGALAAREDGIHINRDKCTACGFCTAVCPAKAITFTGSEWTIEKLIREVLKYREYYHSFGGGVTVSGGEPLFQHEFISVFLKNLKESGINTALDTCGLASEDALHSVLPFVDEVLFDIKLMDNHQHRQHTGQSNTKILSNLLFIANQIRKGAAGNEGRDESGSEGSGTKLWIRTPLIPNATATTENIAAIGKFIQNNITDVVSRWELCVFNSACRSKYEKLGRDWSYKDCRPIKQNDIDRFKAAALMSGFDADKLVISGLIAVGGPFDKI